MKRDRNDILVIEDDRDIREDLAELLRDQGYRVFTASNGLEALQHLRRGGRPCVILLDLMMPVMDGWEFRRRMLADDDLAEVPVVLLSGASDVHEHALRLHVSEVVPKPIALDRLYETVDRFCDGC